MGTQEHGLPSGFMVGGSVPIHESQTRFFFGVRVSHISNRGSSQLSCGPGCAGAMRGPDFELLSALVVYVHICIRCTELCTKLIHCMFDCVVVLVRCFLFVGDCW